MTKRDEGGTDAQAFVQRHLRYNFGAALVDAVGWPTGMSFISGATILPLFVRELGGSNLEVGIVPALFSLGFFLPQLLTANLVEGLQSHRRFVLAVAMVERLFLLLVVPGIFLWSKTNPRHLLWFFFACLGAHSLSMGCNNPGYVALISKLIPAERRGSLYGIGGAVAGVLGIGAALVARWLLASYGMPTGFALCFLAAFLVLTASVLPLGFMREHPVDHRREPTPWLKYIRRTGAILRRDRQFALFLASQVVMAVSSMALAFYTVHAMHRFRVGSAEVGTYTVVLQATTMVTSFASGYMADRIGNRAVLIAGTVLTVLTPLAALGIGRADLYASVFVLSRLAGSALDLSTFNIVMEFCPPAEVPTYTALRATVVAPFYALAPLLGGVLADAAGYPAVFRVSVVAAAASLVLLLGVREPRGERGTLRLARPSEAVEGDVQVAGCGGQSDG
jgi:MFS family permease